MKEEGRVIPVSKAGVNGAFVGNDSTL